VPYCSIPASWRCYNAIPPQRKTVIPGRGATGATAETKERRGCSAANRCAG